MRFNHSMGLVSFMQRALHKGALILVVLVIAGCATTTPQPAHMKSEPATQPVPVTAGGHNNGKEFADGSIAALVELLKQKNVISADEAARIIERSATQAVSAREPVMTARTERGELTGTPAAGAPMAPGKAPYDQVSQQVPAQAARDMQIEEKIAAAVPDWVKRIRFGGDVRLRYENDRYDDNNADFAKPSAPTQLMNTKIDQDKFKYRVRIGAEAQVSEQLTAIVRLSTGNTTNPVSTNNIMGDYMNKDNVVFDRAYLKWQPADFLAVYGGRMPNPWFTPSWLVWDDDLNFEGVAVNMELPFAGSWKSFLNAGAFPLDDYEFSSRDKWFVGGQLGLERKNKEGISARIGAAYYYFSNITGIRNDPLQPGETDWTAPLYQQKGNTLFNISADPAVIKTALASEFEEFNVGGTLDIGFWHPYHVVLAGDYVKNVGFDKSDVARRTGISDPEEDTTGYNVGLSVGYPEKEKFGQWKASLTYKSIGADAVVDAFTDSDFHLGGTNAEGWILATDFTLRKNIWLTLKWLTADEISGPPLAIDVFFVDLNARF